MLRLTDQRKLVAKVMSQSNDHPDVDELHKRVNKMIQKLVLQQFIEQLNLFEEAGNCCKSMILKGTKARYEEST